MDEDRIKGAATNLGGKVQDALGDAIGDSKMQARGKANQLSGDVQNAYGSAKETASDVADTLGSQIDGLMKERPMLALLGAAGVGYVIARLTQR